jgi:hypothetical protein
MRTVPLGNTRNAVAGPEYSAAGFTQSSGFTPAFVATSLLIT